MHGEEFVGTNSKGGEGIIPEHGRYTFNNSMGMMAKADSTGRIGLSGCASLKVLPPR